MGSHVDPMAVRTVSGDIPAVSIGQTLAHEHVIADLSFRWDPTAFRNAPGKESASIPCSSPGAPTGR